MYNLGLLVILVIFLLFAFGTGKSVGDMFCAKAEQDKQDAQLAFIFNLMFAGTFGYWAYYEYSNIKKTEKNIISSAKKIRLDPNMIPDEMKIEPLDFEQLLVESLSDSSELGISESDDSELEVPSVQPTTVATPVASAAPVAQLSELNTFKAVDKGSEFNNVNKNYEGDNDF